MRIDPTITSKLGPAAERVPEAGQATATERQHAASRAADTATVRFDHARLEQLRAELDRVPEIRQERVDALRSKLLGGNYKIDEHAVAEAIWADLLPPARPGE